MCIFDEPSFRKPDERAILFASAGTNVPRFLPETYEDEKMHSTGREARSQSCRANPHG
jgi:hypothetical protein